MLGVEQWAEIRRMHVVEGLSIREIARRSGRDRNTVRAALRSDGAPRYRRGPRPSKLDPFKPRIHELPQPYLRWDRNDYSLDPRFAGRRVEVRVGQRRIAATALDTGEAVASHRRSFAKHLTFTDPAHQALLDQLRGERRHGPEVEVELRPLARYDELIGA